MEYTCHGFLVFPNFQVNLNHVATHMPERSERSGTNSPLLHVCYWRRQAAKHSAEEAMAKLLEFSQA